MKKEKNVIIVLSLLTFILGILPFIFANMSVVSFPFIGEVTGFEAAFGNEDFDPNAVVMLAYILPLIGGILAILNGLTEGSKLATILSLSAFVAGAILIFLIPQAMEISFLNNSFTFEPTMEEGITYAAVPTIIGGVIQLFYLAYNRD